LSDGIPEIFVFKYYLENCKIENFKELIMY